MQGLLRFTQLITMTIWVGGLIFFAFVLAPAAFHVLPSIHQAGLIVGASLKVFDNVSLVCGALFLGATALMFKFAPNRIKGRYELEFLLAGVMLLATAYLTFNIVPAMDRDQLQAGGDINAVEKTNPSRIHFETFHARSEHVAGTILFLGLGVLFLMSREHLKIEDRPA